MSNAQLARKRRSSGNRVTTTDGYLGPAAAGLSPAPSAAGSAAVPGTLLEALSGLSAPGARL
ncbi:hypothetical protein GCM10010342_55290 [Streptomyces anulatus]|nr:hypothetical protein GCM10010342_55290 [Streptomyces anulatus]